MKPNVVFLFTDDQRFDTIAALGNDQIITPNLDRLVERGTAFTQAHIPSGTSGAVCMPSRAMLHSGRTLFHLSGAGQTIPSEHTTIGEAFQAAGYRTFGAGKWHNGPESFARSFTDGGDVMFGGMADHWNVPMCHFSPDGTYPDETPAVNDPFSSNNLVSRRVDHISFGKHSTDIVTEDTVTFIQNYASDQPFLTYTAFLAPHDPRTMPEKYLRMYDPEKLDLPPNFLPEHPFRFGMDRIRDELLAPFPRTPEDTRRQLAEYYAMITHLDDALGRIVGALEERDLLENTIIVFAGDNGLALGQHGLFGKQSHYEHSVRVPLLFAGPGIPKGERREQYAYLLDIFPTLCELTDVAVPDSVEGQSLKAIIEGSNAPVRESLYFGLTDLLRGYKDTQHKLVLSSFEGRNRIQLFDIKADPWEMNDLAGDSSEQERIAAMYKKLCQFRDEWDDRDSEFGSAFWSAWESAGGLPARRSVPE
jgi:arylsulfatase A-like enzyme